MTNQVALVLILTVCGWVCDVQAGQSRFSVGLEMEGELVLQLTYVAQPIENHEDFNNLIKGRLSQQDLDEFNLGDKYAKSATLMTKKDLTLGQIELPAGKYPAGFNADEKGNLFFVVWVDGKARKTPLEVKELKDKEASLPNLTFLCMPQEEGSALTVLYGTHYAMIPVKAADDQTTEVEEDYNEDDWLKATDNKKDGFSGR